METGLFWIVPVASILALVLAWYCLCSHLSLYLGKAIKLKIIFLWKQDYFG